MSRTKAHKFKIKCLGTIEIYKNYIKVIKRFELERTSFMYNLPVFIFVILAGAHIKAVECFLK